MLDGRLASQLLWCCTLVPCHLSGLLVFLISKGEKNKVEPLLRRSEAHPTELLEFEVKQISG